MSYMFGLLKVPRLGCVFFQGNALDNAPRPGQRAHGLSAGGAPCGAYGLRGRGRPLRVRGEPPTVT